MLVFTLRNVTFPRLKALKREAELPFRLDMLLARHGLRIALAGIAGFVSFGAWVFNADNRFTYEGVFCWVGSVVLWTIVFAGPLDRIENWLSSLPKRAVAFVRRPVTLHFSWTMAALLVILAVAAWFRFSRSERQRRPR